MLSKPNKTISGISKERLYEELFQYKNTLNALRKELALVKSDNVKKTQEISKKDKVLEDIVTEVEANPLLVGKPNKAKEAYLVTSLKSQFKEIKNQLNTKTEEYEQLKKHIKNTRFRELQLEINTLNEELMKMKNFYALSLQQNQVNENIIQELEFLKSENMKQKELVNNQQQIINSLESDLKVGLEENDKIKQELDGKRSALKRLNLQLDNQKEINQRVMKSNEDNMLIKNLKKNHEKQLIDMNKKIDFFMGKAE